MSQAAFTINGTPSETTGDRIYIATHSEVLSVTLETNPSQVLSAKFEVYDPNDTESPLASKSAPLLAWNENGLPAITLGPVPYGVNDTVTITMPATGVHSYLIRCTVSTAGDGSPLSQVQVFERLVTIFSLATSPLIRKTIPNESTQARARGYSDAFNDMVDAITNAGGGGGGSPGGPTTSIQYNNGGVFGGSINLVWTGTDLEVIGNLSVTAGGNLLYWDGSILTVAGEIEASVGDKNTPVLTLINTSGVNGAEVEFKLGLTDPNASGGTPGDTGDLYIAQRASAIQARLYMNHGGGNQDWWSVGASPEGHVAVGTASSQIGVDTEYVELSRRGITEYVSVVTGSTAFLPTDAEIGTIYTFVNGNLFTNLTVSGPPGQAIFSGEQTEIPQKGAVNVGFKSATYLRRGTGWLCMGQNGRMRVPQYTETNRDTLSTVNGDLVYNVTSQQLEAYISGSWTSIGGGVTGPGTSTDNAVARFDGTSGAIQESVVLIGDTGAVTGVLTINGVTIENHSARHDPGGADALSTAAPSIGIGAANSEGVATSFARSDHDHTLRTGTTDLTLGAIADGQFLARSGTSIIGTTPAGAGDVVGPASATDNAVARFDAVTGKLIQNSVVLIDDTGGVTGVLTINGVTVENHSARHDPGGADALSTAAPSIGIGASNSEGAAASFARSDHNHTLRTGATDLTIGAIADGEVVVRSGTTLIGTSGGTGDVVGPASATDSAIARFDTTTGKLLQDSVVLVGDTGIVTGVLTINGVTVENHSARHDPGGADALTTAAPSIGIGASNSEGVATSYARSDHNHTLRTGTTDLTIGAIADGQTVVRSGTSLIGAAAGTGDVVGPASATDNAVARFDTTTGKLIQNSVVLIGDTGVITGVLTVNGVTVENHSARHDPGGADALTTAAPSIGIGAANSEGVATSYARSDHNHTIRTGTTDLTMGAVADGEVLTRSGTTIVGTTAGTGDVSGPGSSTDTAIPRWNGIGGDTLSDSGVLIDALDNISGAGTINGVTVENHSARHDPGGADALTTAAPSIGIGASNSEGVATSFARSDHNHTLRTGTTDLTIGAIADGQMITRSGTTLVGAAIPSGDVVGPASATDNAVARFDATTGKLIQNSVVLIGDTGVVTGVLTINGVTVENHSARHDPGGADALTTAAPSIGIGASNSEGTATSFARSDHNHTLRTGSTDLTMGTIADGDALVRDGTSIEGYPTITDFDGGSDTNTTTTWTTKVSVTTPAIDATWLVDAVSLVSNSNTTMNASVRLQNTTDAATLGRAWESEMSDSANILSSTFKRTFTTTAVGGAKTIALQHALASGTGTLTISDACISIRRIA